jgi:predicted ATPase/DNA-binding SARP family transcriptional activator
MEFRVLGPLEVLEDGRQVELGGAKQRALLAILLLHANEVVSSDRLIEAMWDEQPPETAQKALQVYVSRLRKALGKQRLETKARGYRLRLAEGELDLERFRRLAENRPREALGLWRGEPLSEFAYQRFAQTEIARLEELRLSCVERRIEQDLEDGRHAALVGELEPLVREHPLRERLRAHLMLALYRSGRQAEALEAYRDARRVLTEELGLEPTDELKQLQRAILAHDPSLSALSRSEAPHVEPTTDFVGRASELETLRAALGDAVAGRGRVVLISGEPGIGKSRLADELIGHARGQGARVLVGRCWEAGGAPAYWPWIQSLRTYIRDCGPELLREQLGLGGPDLAQLFPELHELLPDLPAAPSIESEGARFRLFDATAGFLKAAAHSQPLVLVLDDLHAGDEPSLLLLQFLARELGDGRLLVVALYRDVDPSLREPLTTALAELTREPVTRHLSLIGLAAFEVADFVERTTDSTPSDELVAAIYDETDGNPLFVGEIVRLLAAEGWLEAAGGRFAVPQSVREVIERRVRRLGEEPANLLTLASVLGREFEPDVLAHFSERSPEDTLLLLDEAITERLVGEVPGSRDRLRFAHELIRDTLYDGLAAGSRVRLHRRAGEVLETLYGGNLDPHLAELAHHFTAAALGGDVDKAIGYSRRAAERATMQLAYEEAVRLYESALELTKADDEERCELLLALGDVQARAGDTPPSKETLLSAAALAERLGRSDLMAEAALRYGGRLLWEVSREDEQHASLLERALDALDDTDSALRVRLLARLAGGPLRAADFPRERREELSLEAVAMARRIGDPGLLASALHGHIQAALLAPDRADDRRELIDELLAAATEAGDKEAAIEGHEERVLTLLNLGDRQAVDFHFAAMEKLAGELRQPAQYWLVAVHRALRALLQGRLSEAEELVSEALRVGERTQSWNVAVSYGLQLFALRREQGRLEEVENQIRASAERYVSYVTWRCVLAVTALELGQEADARGELDALAQDDFAAVPFDEQWLLSLTLLADVSTALGDPSRSGALHRLLLPFEDRIAVSYPEFSTGSVARSLGLLAATLECWDDAERHFEVALRMNDRMSARPWLARTQQDYARMLGKRGHPGDAERAEKLLLRAHGAASEIGMSLT